MADYETTKIDLHERFTQLVRTARVVEKNAVLKFGEPRPNDHDQRKKAVWKAIGELHDCFIECIACDVFAEGNDLSRDIQEDFVAVTAILNRRFPPGKDNVDARRDALANAKWSNKFFWQADERSDLRAMTQALGTAKAKIEERIGDTFPILRDRLLDEPAEDDESATESEESSTVSEESSTESEGEEAPAEGLASPIRFPRKRNASAAFEEPKTPEGRAADIATPSAPKRRRFAIPSMQVATKQRRFVGLQCDGQIFTLDVGGREFGIVFAESLEELKNRGRVVMVTL